MKCADIRDILLADFADDELSTDKKALVDRHLDACPSCREVLKAVRAVDAQFVISEVPVLPPEEIWDNIRQQIEARPVSPLEKVAAWWEDMLRGGRPTFVYGSFASALIVLLVVALPLVVTGPQVGGLSDTDILAIAYLDEETSFFSLGDVGNGTSVENLL